MVLNKGMIQDHVRSLNFKKDLTSCGMVIRLERGEKRDRESR